MLTCRQLIMIPTGNIGSMRDMKREGDIAVLTKQGG